MAKFTWNEENTARLVELAGSGVVSQEQLGVIADELGTSPRSVGSKLRNMGHEVQKAGDKASKWSEDQANALVALIEANAGQYTYAELAEVFENGAFTAKEVQGKVLSLELFDKIRETEKKAAKRTYTPEEEARFVDLVGTGATVEVLSAEFNRPVSSIRGKALSLLRSGEITEMPKQAESSAKQPADVLADIDVSGMSVAEIAEATGKTERGIKSMLTHRGLTATDYDGAARKAKLEAKNAE